MHPENVEIVCGNMACLSDVKKQDPSAPDESKVKNLIAWLAWATKRETTPSTHLAG